MNPATTLHFGKSGINPNLIVMHKTNYMHFKIYTHYITWSSERIIWIAFYKNDKNDKCLIKQLPKDVIHFIIGFLGVATQVMFENLSNKSLCI